MMKKGMWGIARTESVEQGRSLGQNMRTEWLPGGSVRDHKAFMQIFLSQRQKVIFEESVLEENRLLTCDAHGLLC
jgi:hypothetical protein